MRLRYRLLATCIGALIPTPVPGQVTDTLSVRGLERVDYYEVRQAARRTARDSLLRELQAARARWARRPVSHVRYRVEILCACIRIPRPPAYTIVEVVGDSLLSVRDSAGRPARPLYPDDGRQTAAWLFGAAERAIRGSADLIDVRFDAEFGLPLLIRTDELVSRTDDELEIRVSHLENLRE